MHAHLERLAPEPCRSMAPMEECIDSWSYGPMSRLGCRRFVHGCGLLEMNESYVEKWHCRLFSVSNACCISTAVLGRATVHFADDFQLPYFVSRTTVSFAC